MLRNTILALVFVLSFTGAQAEQAKNYFGVSFTSFEEDRIYDFDAVDGDGFTIAYGHRLNQLATLEASFSQYEYDDYEQGFENTVTGETGTLYISGDAESLDLSLLLKTQLQVVHPFLVLGYMDFDAGDATGRVSTRNDDELVSGSSESEAYLGFGADFPIPDSEFSIRVSHKIVGGDIDIDFTSLGVIVNF